MKISLEDIGIKDINEIEDEDEILNMLESLEKVNSMSDEEQEAAILSDLRGIYREKYPKDIDFWNFDDFCKGEFCRTAYYNMSDECYLHPRIIAHLCPYLL